MYARNQWYVAAWSRDLKREPLARLICGEPVVIYRGEDGISIAMEDACPHRLLPLSMGLIEGNSIRCRYHGLLLGPDGRCREMPGRDTPNRAVNVATYTVLERYNVGVAKVERGASLACHDESDMRSFVINFVTPATERSCTYFWGNARQVPADDPMFDEFTRLQGEVFLEDVEVLQAQQRSIDRLPQRKLRAFGIDSGGVRARLMLERLLRDTQIPN